MREIPPGGHRKCGRVDIVPAEPHHVYELAPRLRDADREEIEGLGHGVKQALWRGYKNSVVCRTAFVDGEIAAMWGLAVNLRPGVSCLSDIGTPWLLAAPAATRVPLSYVRIGKAEVAAMLALKPRLENYVAANYAAAVRFLALLGFTLEEPVPLPPAGALYRRFHYGFA